MRAPAGSLCIFLLATGCVTPMERGEQHYREGDPHAALESWEAVPQRSAEYAAAQQRIEEVTLERAQLVDRYLRRARYFERHRRLAESLLNYRLALRLQHDEPTMAHVQELARTLVSWKKQHWDTFDAAFAAHELAQAQEALQLLETFDPFDPQLTLNKSLLEEALTVRVNEILSRGRRFFSDGAYTKAQKAFREVLALDRTNEVAQGHLAYIVAIRQTERGSNGSKDRAALEKLQATETEIRAEGLYQNALTAEKTNDPYAAIRYDLLALTADPKHENAQKHLVRLRTELMPKFEALVEQGRSAFREEDLQAALDYWNRALLIDPNDDRVKKYAERAQKLLEELERLRATPSRTPEVSAE